MKGYRYTVTELSSNRTYGLFNSIQEFGITGYYYEKIYDAFDDLPIPDNRNLLRNQKTESYFTEYGKKYFQKGIDLFYNAYIDFFLPEKEFGVKESIIEIDKKKIIYADKYQIIIQTSEIELTKKRNEYNS